MTEQRKYHRVPVALSVTCEASDGDSFEGSVKDISFGGMFVECENPPPFGVSLTLLVTGLSNRELKLPAVVRWSEARGFGVQFGLLGAYATHAIVDLVKKSST